MHQAELHHNSSYMYMYMYMYMYILYAHTFLFAHNQCGLVLRSSSASEVG